MIQLHQFKTLRTGSPSLSALDVPINRLAPSGFYLSEKNERYLVCDAVDNRFVVILDHDEYDRFTSIDLGELPLGTGSWSAQVDWNFPDFKGLENSEEVLGHARVRQNTVELYVQSLGGARFWETVAYGRTDAADEGIFDRWTLIDEWNDVFFFI